MEDKDYIQQLLDKARAAQAIFETYDQAHVDEVVRVAGKIIYDNAETLAQEAMDETHFGHKRFKIGKHTVVLAHHYAYMKGKKSVGLIEDDPINRVKTYAKPMGVICCVTPSTNPTSTVGANCMCAFKARNAVIVAPHPGAKNCSKHAVDLIRGELRRIGAPEDLLQVIEAPSIQKTSLLMSMADVTIATGGAGMVRAAYSSGKPSFGVGQGNEQVIIDRDWTDLDRMADIVVESRYYDLGVSCSGEQFLHIPREMLNDVLAALTRHGAYLIEDEAIIDKIKAQTFVNGTINRAIVGKSPHELGKILGIGEIPEDAKVLLFKVQAFGKEDMMCREIVCPMMRYSVYDTFEEAVVHAKANLMVEGAGHTSVIWSKNDAHIDYAAAELPLSRLLVSQRGNNSSGNTTTNGLVPTMSLGCGTWGGNATCDNLNYLNLMNKTRVAYCIEDAPAFDHKAVWDD